MTVLLSYRRSPRQILRAFTDPLHYRSLLRACVVYRRPLDLLVRRYVCGGGAYPGVARLRAPGGTPLDIEIRSHYDVLTVQEIFVWRCYPCTGQERVIVDLGANIGVSMLYFLTHAPLAQVIGIEPMNGNAQSARRNLSKFTARSTLTEAAVMDYDGEVTFLTEPTGRYSGVARREGTPMTYHCVDINRLLDETAQRHGRIDLMKIDIEGAEGVVLSAMTDEAYSSIDRIAVEGDDFPLQRLAAAGFQHTVHRSGVHWFQRADADSLVSPDQGGTTESFHP